MPDDLVLSQRIATLLRAGTIVAAVLFTVGAVITPFHTAAATWALTAGCSVLVLLPVLRLLLMSEHFVRGRAGWLALASVTVLALVIASALTGLLFATG